MSSLETAVRVADRKLQTDQEQVEAGIPNLLDVNNLLTSQ